MLKTNVLTEQDACMVLNGLKGFGAGTAQKLLQAFESPQAILNASKKELSSIENIRKTAVQHIRDWQNFFDLEKEKKELAKLKGDFIHYTDPDYPSLLKHIYDPPTGLYCLGSFHQTTKTIAIVGSRRATLYGLKMARKLAHDLAKAGYLIISGMARGIDSAAHEGALEANGRTVAVLGCGANVIYPPESQNLYNNIQHSGAVLSEFPLGQNGDKHTFPMRNRIISGMAQAVIVIETDIRGGSMITARMAGEHNRQVFALPGRVDQVSSRGCHELIRDGAILIRHADDVLEELECIQQMSLGLESECPPVNEPRSTEGLTEVEIKVFKILNESGNMVSESIADAANLSMPEVNSALMMLELKKYLVKRADGHFETL